MSQTGAKTIVKVYKRHIDPDFGDLSLGISVFQLAPKNQNHSWKSDFNAKFTKFRGLDCKFRTKLEEKSGYEINSSCTDSLGTIMSKMYGWVSDK